MKKYVVIFLIVVMLGVVLGFQWKERNKLVTYRLEVLTLLNQETTFNATVLLSGRSIRLLDQKTPYSTTIEASDIECLIDASNQVKVILTSKNGKLESHVKSAYIKADRMKKRILGI